MITSLNRIIFVTEKWCVFLRVETWFLNIIEMNCRLSRVNSTPIDKQTWANHHTSVWLHPKRLLTHQLHTFPVVTHLTFILLIVSGNGDWTYSVFLKHIHCIISKHRLQHFYVVQVSSVIRKLLSHIMLQVSKKLEIATKWFLFQENTKSSRNITSIKYMHVTSQPQFEYTNVQV